MIAIVEWQVFHTKYLNAETVFVNEFELFWEFYTTDGKFIVKTILPKHEEQEKNLLFIERFLQGKTNVVKVMSMKDTDDNSEIPSSDVSTDESTEGLRQEDVEDEEIFQVKFTTENENHYHSISIDSEGNGITTRTFPSTHDHVHEINNNTIVEYEEHSHDIVESPLEDSNDVEQ